MTTTDDDAALAELLELALSGRPERMLDPTVQRIPAERHRRTRGSVLSAKRTPASLAR